MRKLRQEAYHLVVLLRRELADCVKAHLIAELFAEIYRLGRVLCRWGNDVVCAAEYLLCRILNAAELTSGHGVSSDVLKVAPEHLLHLVHNAALYTRHVRYERVGLYIPLIVPEPLQKGVGVQGEDEQVKLTYILWIRRTSAVRYKPFFQRVVY